MSKLDLDVLTHSTMISRDGTQPTLSNMDGTLLHFASSFNRYIYIGAWDLSAVESIDKMFMGTKDISGWDIYKTLT